MSVSSELKSGLVERQALASLPSQKLWMPLHIVNWHVFRVYAVHSPDRSWGCSLALSNPHFALSPVAGQ